MKQWMFLAFVLCVAIAIGASCSATEEAILAGLGEGCLLDSDCNGALICVFRRCHIECETSADCPLGPTDERLACRLGEPPHHVCQLDDEYRCALHSDCPSDQVCGPDLRCRDECLADPDCVTEQVCAQKLCAELDELADGRLPNASGQNGEGRPCAVNSECEDPLLCIGGRCLFECVTGADCPSGECVNNHCVPVTTEANCVPVAQQDCSDQCDPGFTGVRLCQPDLTWGPCNCLSGGGGAGGGGGGGVVSFGSPQTLTDVAIPSGVQGIQLAQLDAGTVPDIVVTAAGPATLALGDGAGDFDWTNSTTSPAAVSVSFTTGELTGDANIDIAGHNTTDVFIFAGDGNGGVGSPTTVPIVASIAPDVFNVRAVDLDGDGDLDLLCLHVNPPETGAFVTGTLNLGSGTWSNAMFYSPNGVPTGLAVGDFNVDGDPDLAVALTTGQVELRYGDGAGNFSFGALLLAGQGILKQGLASADLNGDNRDDLVALANPGGMGKAVVLLSLSTGGFAAAVSYDVINMPYALTLADLNGDGRAEIIAGGIDTDSALTVWTNAGDGTFVDVQTLSVSGAQLQRAFAADINADSIMDLVTWQFGGDQIYTFLGQ